MYTTYLQRKEIGDTWCKNPKNLVDFRWNDSKYNQLRALQSEFGVNLKYALFHKFNGCPTVQFLNKMF